MTFRFKTIIGIASIEAVLLGALVISGLWYITNSAEREFLRRAYSTVTAFALTTKDAVLSSDLASLESFVNETLNYPGVRYARIRDAEGRVLAAAGNSELLSRPFHIDERLDTVDDGVLDTGAEIQEGGASFGNVEIGLSVDDLQNVIRNAKRYGFGIGALEMLLVGLFSFILGGYLTRQLLGLTSASERIASGDFGYQIPAQGRDELARTAQAFNRMSSEVAAAYSRVADREAFLRGVLNTTLDAIIVIDKEGHICSFNAGAEVMLGYSSNEMIGKNVSVLVPKPHKKAHDGYIHRYLGTGSPGVIGVQREFEAERKDGSRLPISLRVTEMRTDDEPSFIGVMHDISERKRYEQTLTNSLYEKETLLKEIHHRVKNNLLVVSSILEMQDGALPEPHLHRVLQECQDRIYSMALIHEKLYRSETLAEVDFACYLEDLIDHFTVAYRIDPTRIRIHTELAPISLNVETATPLGLIVNELLSNALQHAFPGDATGAVWVSCRQDADGRVVMCVRDNGGGLPRGFVLERVETLGLQLVKLLARQLEARLSVDGEAGTAFQLLFNELKYQDRVYHEESVTDFNTRYGANGHPPKDPLIRNAGH